ncbi:MAG TPA: GNAT family protein [Dehalococcoidia bacterium]|nr:GNAT family protein [Dehalococcoidia bacterium]
MLRGKLVCLRPVTDEDLERCWHWMNDPEVTRYLNRGYPVSRLEEKAWVEQASKQTTPPEITLAIDTAEGRHIGTVGLHHFDRESRVACLGIAIGDREYWSNGYGTDTIVSLLRFAFDEINLHRVWLDVHEANARAIACYRKCGFVEEARLRQHRYKMGRYWDSLIMGVLANEFRALHPTEAGA